MDHNYPPPQPQNDGPDESVYLDHIIDNAVENRQLRNDVDDVQSHYGAIQDDIDELGGRVTDVENDLSSLDEQTQRQSELQDEFNSQASQSTIDLQNQLIELQSQINELDQMSYAYNEYRVYVTPENYDEAVAEGYISPEQFDYHPGTSNHA